MVGPGSTPCLILCNNYFLQPSSCSITVFDKSYIVIQRSWFLLQRKLCLEDPSSCLSATVYVMSSSIPNSKFKKFFKLDISAITFSVSCDSTMADQKLSEPALKREQLDEFVSSLYFEQLRFLELRLLQDLENNDECRKNGSLKRLNDQSDVCGFRSCFKNHYDSLPNQRCLRNREEVIQETMEMELENMMELGTLKGKKTYSFKNGTRSALNLENTTRSFLDNNKSNDNNWNGEMTLPLLVDKSTVCMLNKDEEVDEPLSPGKHMKTAQSVLSLLIATIALLWILTDLCSLLSIIKLQPEHGPLPIRFSLLEPVGFMVFVWAVAAMIVIGAPFSRLVSAILLFWGIWLLVRSSQSLTTLCLPILGILLMVWHLCSRKSSCQIKGNEQGSEAPKIKPMRFTLAV